MGLGQLCNLNEPTYPELVRQFIASTYVNCPNDSHQEGFLAFVVQKVYFELSFTDLCGLFGLRVYRSSHAKESLIRNPVLRYATRLIGSLLYGTTTAASVTQWELCLLYQGVRQLLPAFGNSTFPPATAFNMGAVLAANLAGYKGRVTKSKNSACGFGAVITRIRRHVGVDFENHQVALDRSHNIAWNYLNIISLVSKEFIAGPHSKITPGGPYVYVFQDRAKKTLYCHLPQIGLTALLSKATVEFLPPANALIDKPSFFTPKYQSKGKVVDDEEGEDEAAQVVPEDDSQPHQTPASTSCKSFHRTPLRARNNI
uniref:Arabidopsis retrotransposon Orf1 C-terminal domain-containing protein n=1 Tax=Brassica oleracea var. oleracea TaxID=109376 RepID=A0A0D2ZS37_BRAOL